MRLSVCLFFSFFDDAAPTEIYTLSLHDALPISSGPAVGSGSVATHTSYRLRGSSHLIFRSTRRPSKGPPRGNPRSCRSSGRSEEHTSELQSHSDLVCRLLLEKKNEKHTEHMKKK